MISTAVWPAVVVTALIWAVAGTRVFAGADQLGRAAGRVSTLDGLRGFLALAVFFHHGAAYQGFLTDGVWQMTPSHVLNCFGAFGVMLFFMTTGYLFWSKLRRTDGRPDWLSLYVGRVFRIGPVYLLAVAAMLALVFANTGLSRQVPASELAASLFKWMTLGVLRAPDVNGFDRTWIWLAGVTWSLRFEWLFYASLPVLALLARRRRGARVAMLTLFAAAMLHLALTGPSWAQSYALILPLFLGGMACAELPVRAWMRGRTGSAVALAALIGAFAVPDAASAAAVALLGVAFWMVVAGCDLFGLLRTRAALRLGEVSYGIYLLQGLALALMLRPAPLRAFALAGPVQYWLLEAAAVSVLLAMALGAHVWLERPGIAMGRRVSDGLAVALRRKTREASLA